MTSILFVVYTCLVLSIFVEVILLFKMISKQKFSVLPSVPEVCLLEKNRLAQLRSSMSYSAISYEFMVANQLHIYNKVFLNRNIK